MKILIATGIYPPKIGGPAQYAKKMEDLWRGMGHQVEVKTYTVEDKLPTGIRHLVFFLRIIPSLIQSDFIFALDTFSVGFPATLASNLFGKKIIIRTGGDFLWEGYVERTGDLVLLRDFYKTRINNFSIKERIIFNLTKWTLNNVDLLVFSTNWQRDIFLLPYGINREATAIVENHYDKKENNVETQIPDNKNFIAGTRPLGWKNIPFLKEVFERKEIKNKGVILDVKIAPYKEFMGKISSSYAVILVSLGDISPHMVLDAINLNKPFILTEECGILDRVGGVSLLVNPRNQEDIMEKVSFLIDEDNYKKQVEKIKSFSFLHTWEEIANEFIGLYKSLK